MFSNLITIKIQISLNSVTSSTIRSVGQLTPVLCVLAQSPLTAELPKRFSQSPVPPSVPRSPPLPLFILLPTHSPFPPKASACFACHCHCIRSAYSTN
ncbi:hypothetical protein Mapa_010428 [Marchantia paleacea]|nr:hypothetical protein Mapa_010428 [Marchantia paleacea]